MPLIQDTILIICLYVYSTKRQDTTNTRLEQTLEGNLRSE